MKKSLAIVLVIGFLLNLSSCSSKETEEETYTPLTIPISTSATNSPTVTPTPIVSETVSVVSDLESIKVIGGNPSTACVYRAWINPELDSNEYYSVNGVDNSLILNNYDIAFYSGNRYSYVDQNNDEVICDVISVEDNFLFINSMDTLDSSDIDIVVESEYENEYLSYYLPCYSDFLDITFGEFDSVRESLADVDLSCVFIRQSVNEIPIGIPYFYVIDSNFRYGWSDAINGIANSSIAIPQMYYLDNSIYVADNLNYGMEVIESDLTVLPYSECIESINNSIGILQSERNCSITPYATELCYIPILSWDSEGIVMNESGLYEYYLVPCWVVYFQNTVTSNRFAGAVIVNATTGQAIMEGVYE